MTWLRPHSKLQQNQIANVTFPWLSPQPCCKADQGRVSGPWGSQDREPSVVALGPCRSLGVRWALQRRECGDRHLSCLRNGDGRLS